MSGKPSTQGERIGKLETEVGNIKSHVVKLYEAVATLKAYMATNHAEMMKALLESRSASQAEGQVQKEAEPEVTVVEDQISVSDQSLSRKLAATRDNGIGSEAQRKYANCAKTNAYRKQG